MGYHIRTKTQELGTRTQRLGLISLRKRITNQELVICRSEKSGKLIAIGPGEYLAMGAVHIGDDRPLKEGEADKIQQTLNEHTSAWINMLNH